MNKKTCFEIELSEDALTNWSVDRVAREIEAAFDCNVATRFHQNVGVFSFTLPWIIIELLVQFPLEVVMRQFFSSKLRDER